MSANSMASSAIAERTVSANAKVIAKALWWLPWLAVVCCCSGVSYAQTEPVAEPRFETRIEQEAASELELGNDAKSEPSVEEKVVRERTGVFNPDVLTVHRPNYFLPISSTTNLNQEVYNQFEPELADGLIEHEVQFQFSAKVQANQRNLLLADDAVFFGFTLEAWWQLYASQLSSPFRETNYTPEIYYVKPVRHLLGGDNEFSFGLRHQSNGQNGGLSRSWNRLVAGARHERERAVVAVEAWYRLPEEPKDDPTAVEGDDNPDIENFLGHGSLELGWRGDRYEMFTKIRGNTSTGKGGIELAVSFPLFNRFRGLVQYYNGYGESLIEYDRFQQRIGIGVLLSELL